MSSTTSLRSTATKFMIASLCALTLALAYAGAASAYSTYYCSMSFTAGATCNGPRHSVTQNYAHRAPSSAAQSNKCEGVRTANGSGDAYLVNAWRCGTADWVGHGSLAGTAGYAGTHLYYPTIKSPSGGSIQGYEVY